MHHHKWPNNELKWNTTGVLMETLQSDLLSCCTLSVITVQWLKVFFKIVTFYRFFELRKEDLKKTG